MRLCELSRGNSPLIIDVPHAGTHVPDAIALRLTQTARTVPDTDWHVDRLYAFARGTDTTMLVATHSRYVVDLNRDPSGAALYQGADNTELCPTRTFANAPIYVEGEAPSEREIAARRAVYFDPYHAVLATEIQRLRARHGYAIMLDAHSIASEVPRFFTGRLPDLNLGTVQGASCGLEAQALVTEVLANAEPFTHVVNGRFTGGYVARHYGRPDDGVHALQLEMAQSAYMDEAPPFRYDPGKAASLIAVLERLVFALSEWRPTRHKR
jgi:N-formylglutamate amidohydrolase